MEEKAWYRKYRPKTIDDYMGDHIKQVVNARFTVPDNRPNVMMIYGDRGCGKTSFARIIAKYYLCDNPINGKPCECCESCESINETLISGESGVEVEGVTEVDATTANGKEAIQQIIEDAIIAPLYSKYKILILDECHMITKTAQNSLLKIIEDIPAHLIVIFATTDPEQVIGTVHSRCQLKLEVKKQTVDEMANRLMYIAEKEKLTTSLEALKIIAKKADRVPRESINLLETIAKNYGNQVTIDNVRDNIGDVDSQLYLDYFKAANTSLENILIFVKELSEKNIEHKKFVDGLIRFVLDCLYIKFMINIEDYPPEVMTKVKQVFKTYSSKEFDVLLQIVETAFKYINTNDTKSELVLITTALRIGKIELLTSGGLKNEFLEAENENKRSISGYKAFLDEEIAARNIKQSKVVDGDTDYITDQFKGAKVVNLGDPTEIRLDTSTDIESGESSEDLQGENKINYGDKELMDYNTLLSSLDI